MKYTATEKTDLQTYYDYYTLKIIQCQPGTDKDKIEQINEDFETLEKLRSYLFERYGVFNFNKLRAIYSDIPNNPTPQKTGYIYDYNSSKNNKDSCQYQIDYITILHVQKSQIPVIFE